MAVKILTETYETPFKSFSTTNWALGNVGDWLKYSIQAEFAVEKRFNITNSLTITDPNILELNDGTNWGDWGFSVGTQATLKFIVKSLDVNGNVTSSTTNTTAFVVGNIIGNVLEANDAFGNPKTTWGYQFGQIAPIRRTSEEIAGVVIFADKTPQGIQLDFSNVTNDNAPSGTLNSHIDGTVTSFVAENTDLIAINATKDFDYYLTPFQSGVSVERASVTYLGNTGHKKNYRIDIYFMLSPFGDKTDAQNGTPPDSVAGNSNITTTLQLTGFPVFNNPNVKITNDVRATVKLGNTGWFDENFNQLPNEFTFTPVVYENATGDVVNSLDFANPITVSTTVSGINNLSGATRFQYGFIWDPQDPDYYEQTPFAFHKSRKVSTGGEAATLFDWFPLSPAVNSSFPSQPVRNGYFSTGALQPAASVSLNSQSNKLFAANDSAMDASDISFVKNGTDVDIKITFRPNAAFSAFFTSLGEQERNYRIWVSVGDQAPNTNQSDRVSILLDTNQLQTVVIPIGEWDGLDINFLDHSQISTDTPVPCGNDMFVEDDLLAKVSWSVDTAVSPTIPIPTGIKYGFLVQNNTTSQQYILDANEVDLTVYPNPTQYNFDTTRGFKLETGNDKNWYKVEYLSSGAGTIENILGWYGYKIRWEDWLKRLPAPPADFYDNTEIQNGENNDWFHYYNTADWTFSFYVDIAATLAGSSVVYQNLKELTVLDYDSNAIITTELKYYRNVVGSPDTKGVQLLGGTDPVSGLPLGVIPKGEIVWLDIEYTRSSGTWANVATSYGVNCIEVANGAGQFSFRQLSSLYGSEFDNPLVTIPGATLTTLSLVSSTILRVSCRIDSNKLIVSNRYKISGRLGCDV